MMLPRLRSVSTGTDFGVTLATATKLCAAAGVALFVVPDTYGARCSGATRWLGGRPVVQLSMRFGKDGQFWLTLFHELGHVLLHPRTEVSIDDDVHDEARKRMETEANSFAAETLLPSDACADLSALRSKDAIVRFAERLQVSPGIVVGRMHHDGLARQSHFNGLKRTYTLTTVA